MQLCFYKTAHDVNGNPRYVVHFLSMDICPKESGLSLSERYALTCKLANTIGGRKYHNKRFGGGIVFQSYNLTELMGAINRVTGKGYTEYRTDYL